MLDAVDADDGCAKIGAASLQRLQVGSDIAELLRGELLVGHESAGLEVLRILNPAGQVCRIVRQRARRQASGGS